MQINRSDPVSRLFLCDERRRTLLLRHRCILSVLLMIVTRHLLHNYRPIGGHNLFLLFLKGPAKLGTIGMMIQRTHFGSQTLTHLRWSSYANEHSFLSQDTKLRYAKQLLFCILIYLLTNKLESSSWENCNDCNPFPTRNEPQGLSKSILIDCRRIPFANIAGTTPFI